MNVQADEFDVTEKDIAVTVATLPPGIKAGSRVKCKWHDIRFKGLVPAGVEPGGSFTVARKSLGVGVELMIPLICRYPARKRARPKPNLRCKV